METSSEKEILVAGFGGQGIVLTGSILGKAAAIHDLKHATMIQAYGPEARGGSCSSQVIISEEEIALSVRAGTAGVDLHEPGGF